MSDIFRKKYHTLLPANSEKIVKLKEAAEVLHELMNDAVMNYELTGVPSREMTIAKANLEQAMMWATKAVILIDQINQEPVKSENQ